MLLTIFNAFDLNKLRMNKFSKVAVFTVLLLSSLTALADTIVVYGASGNLGSLIVDEALERGHKVIGVSRNPDSLSVEHENFSAVAGDVSDVESIASVVTGADAVVISVRGPGPNNYPEESLNYRASKAFIQASRQIGEDAPRVIHIGGGSTLFTNGVLGLDANPGTEGTMLHGLLWGHWLALQNYRATTSVQWTVITPSGNFDKEGARIGTYRTGKDDVITKEDGSPSGISYLDLAGAVIDEIEEPKSINQRMTAAY